MGDCHLDSGSPKRRASEGVASVVLLLWIVALLYHFYTKMGFMTLVAELLGRGGT